MNRITSTCGALATLWTLSACASTSIGGARVADVRAPLQPIPLEQASTLDAPVQPQDALGS